MRLLAIVFLASASLCPAAESAPGRWEGSANIPGGELKLIVDLSKETGKGWIGSIIVPGFGVKGVPLVDRKSGELLGGFQTEASKQNKHWVLTSDRKFHEPMLYHSRWREAPTVATDRQFSIGAVFSTPLVANGVVYFGSSEGTLYALE